MLIDEERVRETAEALLAVLAESDDDELAEIDEVFLVVAISYGPVDDRGERETSSLVYRCTSARPHVQFGMLEQARRAIESTLDHENRD